MSRILLSTLTTIFTVLLLLASFALGGELHGVKMKDEVKIGDKTLVLNGMGLRAATVFKVKVYVASLYVEKKSADPDAILNSDGIKKVELVFLRDVDSEDISKAWREGLEKNCDPNCDPYKAQIKELTQAMPKITSGDSLSFLLLPDQVKITHQGKQLAAISGKGFSKLLLSVWIGKDPPNSGLKEGMLGLNR